MLLAIVVSCLNLTALGAALVGARVCDVYGRRHSLRVGAICYLGASIGQIFAPNLAVFIFSRCLQGVGVGFLSMTVPISMTIPFSRYPNITDICDFDSSM